MARLFISQERLDAWSAEDRIKLEGDRMTLVNDGRSFRLSSAVRFMKVSGDGVDPNKLVGKVKTVTAIEGMGGEHYMNSVICGEVAYDVQQGFLGDPTPVGS